MPVYAKQYGRLGNNLFQKAAAIGYAMKHGIEYSTSGNCYLPKPPAIINENGHQFQELPFFEEWRRRDVLLNGYWQSEKYFAHCREEVLKAFGCKDAWLPYPGWCSIHVRRGDYLNYPDKHPVVTEDYIESAIDQICKLTSVRKFLVFSDDIPFCKEWIDPDFYDGCTFGFAEGGTQEDDLHLMSGCEHHIISNSTFSWWGAWLNQNPDKVVISPSKDNWFGSGNAHLDTSDLIPDSWIQIKY